MFGANGEQITQTLHRGQVRGHGSYRIDVENPAPGRHGGDVRPVPPV